MSIKDKLADLSDDDLDVIADALNVRALDRQSDEYGDGPADRACDLLSDIFGLEVDEKRSYERGYEAERARAMAESSARYRTGQ